VKERESAELQRPAMVAHALGISTAMLRRYARVYEEVYGNLPRDRREGRLYTKKDVERLRTARALVLRKRAPSLESALQNLSEGSKGQVAPSAPLMDGSDPYALLVEELRWLREVVEKQNRRLAMMEAMMMTLLPSRVTRTPAQANSNSKTPSSELANKGLEEKSELLNTGRESIIDDERISQKPGWKQIGLATVLAGVVPTTLATSSVLVGYHFLESADAINHGPLRIAYLVLSGLLQLFPLSLGIWTGLAWPGRHLIGYTLLGLLAGAIQAITYTLFVVLSVVVLPGGRHLQLQGEDPLIIVSTIILFLAGGAFGDSIEKRRAVRGLSNKVSEDDKRLSPRTVVFLQYVLPPVLAFLGISLQVVATVLKAK
jgi:DNA-binding transcriptional MerR regulator